MNLKKKNVHINFVKDNVKAIMQVFTPIERLVFF